jgi:hypothetical protein
MTTLDQVTLRTKIRTVLWGAPPETKAERNLLFKIDWCGRLLPATARSPALN